MTASERWLVTGAMGCIGSWTVRALARRHVPVTAFDLGTDTRRLAQIMTPEELAGVEVLRGDITDPEVVRDAVASRGITNVVHLAALQVPFCRADPPRGALVNVVGTINVFEAVKAAARAGTTMAPLVYTSSIGVYSADGSDASSDHLTVDAPPNPINHYGVFKVANEGNARIYWQDDGIASVGLRPMTVYGVGRDQGMTSGPTKAIVAAVLGRPYRVPFGGATLYQYAADAAEMLVAASRSALDGARVYNMPGTVADGPALVAAIEASVPDARGLVDFEPGSLPFPSQIDSDGIDAIGRIEITPFADGVRDSVAIYRSLLADGRLDPVAQGLEPVPAA